MRLWVEGSGDRINHSALAYTRMGHCIALHQLTCAVLGFDVTLFHLDQRAIAVHFKFALYFTSSALALEPGLSTLSHYSVATLRNQKQPKKDQKTKNQTAGNGPLH